MLTALLAGLAIWLTVSLVNPGPPRTVVLASGPETGLYHQYAQRYKTILAKVGIRVVERMTEGADENLKLLLDPHAKVDIAFMQGGVVTASGADVGHIEMLANLYYEPLWMFMHNEHPFVHVNQLVGKRIAVGLPGTGARALATMLMKANGVDERDADLRPIGGDEAVLALQKKEIDVAFFVGGATSAAVQKAMRDPALELVSMDRAEAYQRRYPFLTRLTLPTGTIDLALNIPNINVELVGTKAMLVARSNLHPALISVLIDAAREVHSGQGVFEAAGEFPGTAPVDLPVSADADQHRRFGPTFLYRIMPFWLASLIERMLIILVPLLAVLVPIANYLPSIMRWRVRSRIYRWYGELAFLEREIATREAPLPIDQWLADLDRIEHAVYRISTPVSYASERYTLREHVQLVRQNALAKAAAQQPTAPAPT
ncbi:MAG: TAXI family TRAP transporter solute-binding subunit [Betaproteobacteria bacterium]